MLAILKSSGSKVCLSPLFLCRTTPDISSPLAFGFLGFLRSGPRERLQASWPCQQVEGSCSRASCGVGCKRGRIGFAKFRVSSGGNFGGVGCARVHVDSRKPNSYCIRMRRSKWSQPQCGIWQEDLHASPLRRECSS